MDRRYALTAFLAAALALAAFSLGRASAQEEEQPAGGMPRPEWTKPVEHHRHLLESCGTFDVSGEMWQMPGADAQPFTAKAKREPILGGMYIKETFLMNWGGMEMQGMLLQGYDTVRKQAVNIWMDGMSPVPSITYCDVAEDGSTTGLGEEPDWLTGQLKKTRTVTRTLEDGRVETTMYDLLPDGTETKTMRLVYDRGDA